MKGYCIYSSNRVWHKYITNDAVIESFNSKRVGINVKNINNINIRKSSHAKNCFNERELLRDLVIDKQVPNNARCI